MKNLNILLFLTASINFGFTMDGGTYSGTKRNRQESSVPMDALSHLSAVPQESGIVSKAELNRYLIRMIYAHDQTPRNLAFWASILYGTKRGDLGHQVLQRDINSALGGRSAQEIRVTGNSSDFEEVLETKAALPIDIQEELNRVAPTLKATRIGAAEECQRGRDAKKEISEEQREALLAKKARLAAKKKRLNSLQKSFKAASAKSPLGEIAAERLVPAKSKKEIVELYASPDLQRKRIRLQEKIDAAERAAAEAAFTLGSLGTLGGFDFK